MSLYFLLFGQKDEEPNKERLAFIDQNHDQHNDTEETDDCEPIVFNWNVC